MVQLTAWPAVTDDDGSGQYGTIGDKAWSDAARDAVEALIHSLTNPTISPADIINEVKAARGSLGTLDGRLDVSLNEDGTLKSQASLVTQAQAKTFVGLWVEILRPQFREVAKPRSDRSEGRQEPLRIRRQQFS